MLWDYENKVVINTIVEDRAVLGAVYHPKLAKFITLGDGGKIYLYDEETMQLEHTYEKG